FDNQQSFHELSQAILALRDTQTVIVHGGGKEISQALRKANREPVFIDGFRVTTRQDIEIVEHVLSNTVNNRIAQTLEKNGIACQRLSGKSGELFLVHPFQRKGYDYGFVGEIVQVNPEEVQNALNNKKLPVVSPVSGDAQGNSYNVNADSAAAALAAALKVDDLIFFTDVPGVRIKEKIISSMTASMADHWIQEGAITGGMVAKMESVALALGKGVQRIHIVQWHGADTLLKILYDSAPFGTTITKD
ncbi:acetylglutamate kinase, partial [candidate division KSB1 bacterium]|nr:acetylglutamate kinase [candidate division KSB1 bacterium]